MAATARDQHHHASSLITCLPSSRLPYGRLAVKMARRTTARERLSGPQRRERILDAAAEAFAAHGYRAASVQDIARAAGVTKPVLYDHFTSKRALFTSLMESARDELAARGAQAMSADT